MAKRRKSQIVMLDHSKAKVELLRKYLEKYLNIIANNGFTKRIDIFDLFCGEGMYEKGGSGSPIEILNALRELHLNNEVLLFLPTQFMYRFDEKGTPQALIEILEELVDLNEWRVNGSVHGFIHQFKEALRKYLGNDFFVDTFTIQKDATTVFCLFFFSSHIRGFEKMLETKWQIDEDEGKGWSYEKTGNLFLALKTNPLEQKLLDFIKNNNKCFNGDVYEYCLRLGFLPVHCNEVFTSLQTEGRLEVGSDSLENIRKGAFYINYESYKREPNKVYFKIK